MSFTSRLRRLAPISLALALATAVLASVPAHADHPDDPEHFGTISGTALTPSGKGVQNGLVFVFDINDDDLFPYVGFFERHGFYLVEDVPDGEYVVCVYAEGYAVECWDDAPVMELADVVTKSNSNPGGIDFVLQLGGTISGTVTGNSGKALRGAEVEAYLLVDSEWYLADAVDTDKKGKYSFSEMAPGTYKLCFWSGGLTEECWNDKVDFDDATPFTVGAGKKVTGKNAQLTVNGPAPAVPSGLTSTADLTTLELSWNPSYSTERFKVRYGTSSKGKGATTVDVVDDETVTLTGLKPNTAYYVDIAAVGENGVTSAYSKRAKLTTRAVATPQNLQLVDPTVDSVTATWAKSADATSYRVRYGTSSSGKKAKSMTVGDVDELLIPDLKANTNYFVDVAAVTTAGDVSSYIKRVKVKTPVVPVPANVALSATNSSVTINWTKSVGATNYRVRYGTSSKGKGAKTIVVNDVDTVTLAMLKAGTKYYVDVAAVTSVGSVSKYSARFRVVTAPILAPTGLTRMEATSSSMALAWDAPVGAVKYRVRYGTSSKGKGAKTVEVSSPDAVLTGLKADTTYYIDVAAVTSGKSVSPYSPRTGFMTNPVGIG